MHYEVASTSTHAQHEGRRTGKLPFAIYALALGLFLMGTTEFVVAGLLPEIAADLQISVADAGLLITVFAVGMVVGAPVMALATLRMQHRVTLVLALIVFALGHVIVALSASFAVVLAARFLTALATGTFWAVAAVAATRLAGPGASSHALGIVNGGGMLATVLGVPLGAFAGQAVGWRGTFWALAVLSLAAMVLIARQIPHDDTGSATVSIRSELSALRSGRLWLVLAACAATTGAVFAAYSYIAPLLTDQAGIPASLIPLVLAVFGLGSVVGSVMGGRLGDSHPHATTIIAPAATTVILLAISLVGSAPVPTTILLFTFGLFGLGANPVLIALAVRYAVHAPTLGSSLSVAAFNTGTAAASWIGGIALGTSFGAIGPVIVGTIIAGLALAAAVTLAIARPRSTADADTATLAAV